MVLPTGNDNSKVNIAVSGAIVFFPEDTVIEYGVNGEIPSFKKVGRVTEDGVTVSYSTSTQTIKGWPENDTVATIITDAEVTAAFSMIQFDETTLELYFNDGIDSATGGYHLDAGAPGKKMGWVFDTVDRVNNRRTRWYFPSAQLTERGDVALNGQGLTELPLTLTAYAKEIAGKTTTAIFWTGPLDESTGS